MTKNKQIYHVESFEYFPISKLMKGRGFTEPMERYIGLRSERDKSVYFWSWGGRDLLYNAIITREKKQKLTLFSFQATESAVRHFVYLVKSRSDSYANKSYEISFCRYIFFVKLN